MSKTERKDRCRKCGEVNPLSNEYCASCGAVLTIATSEMHAQPLAVQPDLKRFEFKWVITGVLIMLGTGTLAVAAGVLWGVVVFRNGLGGVEGIESTASKMLVVLSILTGISFAAGGAIISIMSKKARIAEAVVSSMLAAALLGIAGLNISSDFLNAIFMMVIPGSLLAGAGAHAAAKVTGEKT